MQIRRKYNEKNIHILFNSYVTLNISGCSATTNIGTSKTSANNTLPSLNFAKLGEEAPTKNFDYEYDKNISFTGDCEVFKLVSKDIDKEKFKELAKKFSINIDDVAKILYNDTSKNFYFGTEISYLSVEKSGKLIYSLNRKSDPTKKGKFKPLSDNEAIKAAKDFLKSNGLLPNEFYVSSVVDGLVSEYADGTKDLENRQVIFHRKVNSKEVLGVSRIQVDVGENGLIERVASLYSDIEPYTKYKLIDINTAVDSLKKDKGLEIFNSGKQPKKCKINKIELTYFENSNVKDNSYLYPVYKFTGQTIDEDGKEAEYTGIIQAVE